MPDALRDLDRRITDALSALRCARAVVQRSANSTTRWHEAMAEQTLDGLLDQRPRRGAAVPVEAFHGATDMSRPGR